jgi:hypothetical protein
MDIHKDPTDLAVHFFVVHPTKWMREEMFPVLVRSEIPVSGLDRVEHLPRLCHKYPGSVICINAAHHSGAVHPDWPRLLGDMAPTLNNSRSTVIYLSRPDQMSGHDSLRNLGIRMAFLATHQVPRNAIGQIHAVATKFTAHSRRRSIRVGCGANGMAVFNVVILGQALRGYIRDISSTGMAAIVLERGAMDVPEGTELRDLQLRLRGSLILVNASLVAVRHDAGTCVWIVLFRWGDDLRSKARIQEFISQRLQEELDEFLG